MDPFKVITEFRFDIGHAMLESKTLQGQVEKISTAADNALLSFQRVGMGLVAQMGLVSGGVLGFLYDAIQASDKFSQSQRNLANIFLTNQKAFGDQGLTFQQAMTNASKVMDTIHHKAMDFSLDPNDLLNQTKLIAPVLVSHGLDGANLATSIDIARGLLKSAPTLGVDPTLVGGQLNDAILGHASMNDRLFQRLAAETQPFISAHIQTSQQFNALPAAKRVNMLREALLQFGSNADILRGNMLSLNGQMRVFMSLIKGQYSIFKGIGDVLIEPIKKILLAVNNYLMTKGKVIVDNIAKILKPFADNPEKTLAMFYQAKSLKHDLEKTGKVLFFSAIIEGVRHLLSFIGIQLPTTGALMSKAFSGLIAGLRWIGGFIISNFVPIVMFMGKAFMWIARVFGEIFAIMAVFQGISRGVAMAKIEDAQWIAQHMDRISEIGVKLADVFRKIALPFELAVDGISQITAWVLTFGSISEWVLDSGINPLIAGLDFLGDVVVHVFALISGVINTLVGQIYNISQGNYGALFKQAEWSKLADEGYNDFWNKYHKKDGTTEENAVSNMVTNIGTINVNQAFKENMEPDRVAFAFMDIVKKTAMNPTQSQSSRSANGSVGW